MNVMSVADISKWFDSFKDWGDDYVHCDSEGLYYSHPEANCIELQYPPLLETFPFFAHYVATIGYEDKDFEGALTWVTAWGVWNSFGEGIGLRIVERMNASIGQPQSFEVGHAHRFRADELPDAIGMLMQPMIFAWDAFYLPSWSYGTGEFFLRVSHDSYVSVVTKTKAFHDRIFQDLEDRKMNPKIAPENHKNWFCHPLTQTGESRR